MKLLSTSDEDLKKAAAVLAKGALVAFPTETVYGLGADAFNTAALARVFEAKRRPRFDPLIVHIADITSLPDIIDTAALSKTAKERLSLLSERLWPGPLTLILPKRPEVPDLATAGLATVAVRFPSHPVAQKLINLAGRPVAAPSANRFGCLSPTRASHVKSQLSEKVDYVIDGGKTTVGLESTVLDISGERPVILRPGGISQETIEALLGKVELSNTNAITNETVSETAPMSPGQIKNHYAPKTQLVLYHHGELAAMTDVSNEGRLYFSAPEGIITKASGAGTTAVGNLPSTTRVLSGNGDLTEAAANLFDMLHELDSLGLSVIRAEEAPNQGLGLAINDRLKRAEK